MHTVKNSDHGTNYDKTFTKVDRSRYKRAVRARRESYESENVVMNPILKIVLLLMFSIALIAASVYALDVAKYGWNYTRPIQDMLTDQQLKSEFFKITSVDESRRTVTGTIQTGDSYTISYALPRDAWLFEPDIPKLGKDEILLFRLDGHMECLESTYMKSWEMTTAYAIGGAAVFVFALGMVIVMLCTLVRVLVNKSSGRKYRAAVHGGING